MVILGIFVMVILFFIWFSICCYYGYKIAFTVLAILIIALSMATYYSFKEPSQKEINNFDEKRKGVGYR